MSKKYGVMACNVVSSCFSVMESNCCVCSSLPIVVVHAALRPFFSPKMWIVDYELFVLVSKRNNRGKSLLYILFWGGSEQSLPSMDGKGNHPLFLKDKNLEEGVYRKKLRVH
jgi:hypothetical protein